MEKYGIPTAKGQTFTRLAQAQAYVKKMGAPWWSRPTAWPPGKGVIVCSTEKMAMDALKQIMVDRDFGAAGDKVVVEECLVGEEASFWHLPMAKPFCPCRLRRITSLFSMTTRTEYRRHGRLFARTGGGWVPSPADHERGDDPHGQGHGRRGLSLQRRSVCRPDDRPG
jgi:hypothetical protein